LYRLYKGPNAVNCEMVIRTSNDVAVATNYQTPLTISTCSTRDSFSYDLEFTSSGGTYAEYVVVQVAFVYSIVSPATGKLKRFLRVITARGKTSLGVFANMKDLPRYVFGLLSSPILRGNQNGAVVSADEWITAQVSRIAFVALFSSVFLKGVVVAHAAARFAGVHLSCSVLLDDAGKDAEQRNSSQPRRHRRHAVPATAAGRLLNGGRQGQPRASQRVGPSRGSGKTVGCARGGTRGGV
jgi:hypothetical protein